MDDRYEVAAAQRLVGDVARKRGDAAAAKAAWAAGFDVLPTGIPERPGELSERAELLKRLGRTPEARAIKAKLAAMGFRQGI
jgi:hypothetical protein